MAKKIRDAKQSKQFIETARALGCNEDGAAFERAFAQIAPPKRPQPRTETDRMPRRDPDRIAESDLVVPTLRLAAARADGFIQTSDLIRELEELFDPAGEDAEILEGRADSRFSQKVRNLISHREAENSFIRNGYARYDPRQRGIRITEQGRQLLRTLNG